MEEQFKDIGDLVKDAGLETPSVDFLDAVMSKVDVDQVNSSVLYKPLISNVAWMVIGFIVVMVVCLLLLFDGGENSIFDKIDVVGLSLTSFNNPFKGYTFHKTTVYGILFLSFLFFVQVPMLKRKMDKDFS